MHLQITDVKMIINNSHLGDHPSFTINVPAKYRKISQFL